MKEVKLSEIAGKGTSPDSLEKGGILNIEENISVSDIAAGTLNHISNALEISEELIANQVQSLKKSYTDILNQTEDQLTIANEDLDKYFYVDDLIRKSSEVSDILKSLNKISEELREPDGVDLWETHKTLEQYKEELKKYIN